MSTYGYRTATSSQLDRIFRPSHLVTGFKTDESGTAHSRVERIDVDARVVVWRDDECALRGADVRARDHFQAIMAIDDLVNPPLDVELAHRRTHVAL